MKAWVFALFVLTGCASSSSNDQIIRTFDLGTNAPKSSLPALRSVSVRAPMPYDGVDMLYRLSWKDGAEIAPYGQSRWAAPPAELLRRQLLRALPASGAAPCALDVELQDFSQVFASKEASEAHLELRALLVAGNTRVASRSFAVSEPNAGAGASTGAAAFSRASERAVSDLAGWISSQPACKS